MNIEKFTELVLEKAQGKLKQGLGANWIPVGGEENNGSGLGECSICEHKTKIGNFCPNCGATFLTERQVKRGEIYPRPPMS